MLRMRAYGSMGPLLVGLVLLGIPVVAAQAVTETPHLSVVSNYLRLLGSLNDLKVSAARDLAKEPNTALSNGIAYSTSANLEIGAAIAGLKETHLSEPFDTLAPTLVAFYQEEMNLHKELIRIATAFMGGPKPGVDYGELAAQMPQVRAKLEYFDKSIFEATPLLCYLLLDTKPDDAGHVSRLLVTIAERKSLVETIDIRFGKSLEVKGDKNYQMAAAALMKEFLTKPGFKASDEK